jgi:hypothetical protein
MSSSCFYVLPLQPLWPDPLPTFPENVAVSYQLTAVGGVLPYTFGQSSGSLPTGLSLSSSGLITGTPTVAVTLSPETFTVTDSS